MLFGTFARRIGVTVGALALVVGGGAALAATSGSSSSTIDGAATAGSAAFRVTTTTQTPATAASVPTTGGTLLFPMNPLPKCTVLNNFGDGRSGGRAHEGTDILATLGQEVYAVEDGVLYRQWIDGQPNTELSGNGWNLRGASGTTYAFLHLSGFAPGLQVGSTVVKGQLIAYVGDTGNPDPGNYHLHFEVHPAGGAAVNAYPLLAIPTSCTKY